MALVILRCVFIALAIALGFQLSNSPLLATDKWWAPWLAFLSVLVVAAGVLFADFSMKRKRLDTITGVIFGTIVGLFLTYVFYLALTPLLPSGHSWLADWLRLALAVIVCYSCISILLQTKDDFRFIIPYVEFAKEVKGLKPYVLDTSVVIDGRIADVVETRVIDNQLIMPRFVLAELQSIADSSDRMRRTRETSGLIMAPA